MEIKTTVRCLPWLKLGRLTIPTIDENMEKWKLSYTIE